jgi:hypothetical protein
VVVCGGVCQWRCLVGAALPRSQRGRSLRSLLRTPLRLSVLPRSLALPPHSPGGTRPTRPAPGRPQVAAASSGRYSPAAVRTLIAELSDMGHLYSTVDDDHYKIAA